MGNDMNQSLKDFENSYAAQTTCLIAQAIVTMAVIYNLQRNWRKFPIKQLSPLCTLVALLSFFLLNVISILGRWIQTYNEYYEEQPCLGKKYYCGQCRIFEHPQLQILALIYNGLRELPLILFALKTLRVCICFLDSNKNQLPKIFKILFRKESTIVLVSIAYSILVGLGNYIDMEIGQCSLTPYGAVQTFQFLCPKQSGTVDWITTFLRYFLLTVSYTLSIRTYRELDFKRFIFVIFMFSNFQVVLRCAFIISQIDKLTYHEFYYHSMFLNLCGTIILYPYSNFNRYVQQPPVASVLESFEAFLNYEPGKSILQYYALHRDHRQNTSKYTNCFDHFISVRHFKMLATHKPASLVEISQQMEKILQNTDTAAQIPQALQLRQRAEQRNMTIGNIKMVEKKLSEFCEKHLFREWKRTESRMFLQNQFHKNLVINEKMSSLGIDIGC